MYLDQISIKITGTNITENFATKGAGGGFRLINCIFDNNIILDSSIAGNSASGTGIVLNLYISDI